MADPKNIHTVPEDELEAMVAAALGRAGSAGEMGLSRSIVERMIQRFYDALGREGARFTPGPYRGVCRVEAGDVEYEVKAHPDGVLYVRMVDHPVGYRGAMLLRPDASNQITIRPEQTDG